MDSHSWLLSQCPHGVQILNCLDRLGKAQTKLLLNECKVNE